MNTMTLTYTVAIHTNQKAVFEYVSDWERQSDWILFTTVKLLSEPTTEQEINLLAITKIGPLQLVDTMVVSDWRPYERIIVEHTGRIILGKGIFSINKISDVDCEFVWQEITPVPLGIFGRIVVTLSKPLIKIPFTISLRRLKTNIEAIK